MSSGKEILDSMLKGGKTVDEIIEYFKSYSIDDGMGFEPRYYRSNKSSRQSSIEPEDDSFRENFITKKVLKKGLIEVDHQIIQS